MPCGGFQPQHKDFCQQCADRRGWCELAGAPATAAIKVARRALHSPTWHILGASFEGSLYQSAFMIVDVTLDTAFRAQRNACFHDGIRFAVRCFGQTDAVLRPACWSKTDGHT